VRLCPFDAGPLYPHHRPVPGLNVCGQNPWHAWPCPDAEDATWPDLECLTCGATYAWEMGDTP
jgi:hypothetical protein